MANVGASRTHLETDDYGVLNPIMFNWFNIPVSSLQHLPHKRARIANRPHRNNVSFHVYDGITKLNWSLCMCWIRKIVFDKNTRLTTHGKTTLSVLEKGEWTGRRLQNYLPTIAWRGVPETETSSPSRTSGRRVHLDSKWITPINHPPILHDKKVGGAGRFAFFFFFFFEEKCIKLRRFKIWGDGNNEWTDVSVKRGRFICADRYRVIVIRCRVQFIHHNTLIIGSFLEMYCRDKRWQLARSSHLPLLKVYPLLFDFCCPIWGNKILGFLQISPLRILITLHI